jgi:hypothetical protein
MPNIKIQILLGKPSGKAEEGEDLIVLGEHNGILVTSYQKSSTNIDSAKVIESPPQAGESFMASLAPAMKSFLKPSIPSKIYLDFYLPFHGEGLFNILIMLNPQACIGCISRHLGQLMLPDGEAVIVADEDHVKPRIFPRGL